MEVREGCNVGGESSIGRGRGGCIGEYISGSRCQRLPAGEDLLHEQLDSLRNGTLIPQIEFEPYWHWRSSTRVQTCYKGYGEQILET